MSVSYPTTTECWSEITQSRGKEISLAFSLHSSASMLFTGKPCDRVFVLGNILCCTFACIGVGTSSVQTSLSVARWWWWRRAGAQCCAHSILYSVISSVYCTSLLDSVPCRTVRAVTSSASSRQCRSNSFASRCGPAMPQASPNTKRVRSCLPLLLTITIFYRLPHAHARSPAVVVPVTNHTLR